MEWKSAARLSHAVPAPRRLSLLSDLRAIVQHGCMDRAGAQCAHTYTHNKHAVVSNSAHPPLFCFPFSSLLAVSPEFCFSRPQRLWFNQSSPHNLCPKCKHGNTFKHALYVVVGVNSAVIVGLRQQWTALFDNALLDVSATLFNLSASHLAQSWLQFVLLVCVTARHRLLSVPTSVVNMPLLIGCECTEHFVCISFKPGSLFADCFHYPMQSQEKQMFLKMRMVWSHADRILRWQI